MTVCTWASCGMCGACSHRSARRITERGYGRFVRVNGRVIGAVGRLNETWWASPIGKPTRGKFPSREGAEMWLKAQADSTGGSPCVARTRQVS